MFSLKKYHCIGKSEMLKHFFRIRGKTVNFITKSRSRHMKNKGDGAGIAIRLHQLCFLLNYVGMNLLPGCSKWRWQAVKQVGLRPSLRTGQWEVPGKWINKTDQPDSTK